MASDLTGTSGPFHTVQIGLSATPGNVVRVDLPPWARKFTVIFKTSANADDAGRVSGAGTDGAAIGVNCFPVPSGQALSCDIASLSSTRSVYITGDTASGNAHVILEAGL